jgi:cardiolipin synthase A/B
MKKTIIAFCLFFTLSVSAFALPCYSGKAKLYIQPGAGIKPITTMINRAQKNIRLVIYTFKNRAILNALIKAKKRGVNIKVLIEKKPYKMTSFNQSTIQQFKKANIPFKYGNPSFTFTHEKALITDNNHALIMTGNFTTSGFKYQRNFYLRINSSKIAKQIKSVFNSDWQRKPAILPQSSPLVLSPNNSKQAITQLILDTTKTLDIYIPDINDRSIISALKKSAKKGVKVNVITNQDNIQRNQKTFDALEKLNIHVFVPKNLTIHAKIILSDPKQKNTIAYLGSANLSHTSLTKNRELGVLVCDSIVVKQLSASFSYDEKASVES